MSDKTNSEGQHTFLHHPTTSDKAISVDGILDVYSGDKAELEYIFEEIRRRQLTIVAMQGEDTLLLERIQNGNRCPFWKAEEEQCDRPLDPSAACYNTGWVGGYRSAINIKIVYPPANQVGVSYVEGVRREFKPRPWTIHTPRLKERDVFISRISGTRYEILNLSETLYRGLPLHQEFDLRELPRDKETYIYAVPVTAPLP